MLTVIMLNAIKMSILAPCQNLESIFLKFSFFAKNNIFVEIPKLAFNKMIFSDTDVKMSR